MLMRLRWVTDYLKKQVQIFIFGIYQNKKRTLIEFATHEILTEIFPSRLEAFKPKEYRYAAIVLNKLGYRQDKYQIRSNGNRLRLLRRCSKTPYDSLH